MTILIRITAILTLTACDAEHVDESTWRELDVAAGGRAPVARPNAPTGEAIPDGCDPRDPGACAPGYTCAWVHVEPDGAFLCVFDGDSDNDDLVASP